MQYPAPYVVTHTPMNVVTYDSLGNEKHGPGTPVQRPAIAIAPMIEQQLVGSAIASTTQPAAPNREVSDVDLYIPPSWSCKPHDVIALPGGVEYEVVGFKDWNGHFAVDFNPGSVVELRRIDDES